MFYADRFKDEVDDDRTFFRMVHALDEEFMKNGLRKGKT